MLFGAKPSPSSALYIKNQNAAEFAISNPEAAEAAASIEKDTYMDDYLVSRNTEEEMISLVRDVIRINNAANFGMHGWASNSKVILRKVLGEIWRKVLGMNCNTLTDELGFKIDKTRISKNILDLRRRPTRIPQNYNVNF